MRKEKWTFVKKTKREESWKIVRPLNEFKVNERKLEKFPLLLQLVSKTFHGVRKIRF